MIPALALDADQFLAAIEQRAGKSVDFIGQPLRGVPANGGAVTFQKARSAGQVLTKRAGGGLERIRLGGGDLGPARGRFEFRSPDADFAQKRLAFRGVAGQLKPHQSPIQTPHVSARPDSQRVSFRLQHFQLLAQPASVALAGELPSAGEHESSESSAPAATTPIRRERGPGRVIGVPPVAWWRPPSAGGRVTNAAPIARSGAVPPSESGVARDRLSFCCASTVAT